MKPRICSNCKFPKNLDEFPKHKGRKDDREGVCKVCVNERRKDSKPYKAQKKEMRDKYKSSEEYRQKVKARTSNYRKTHNEQLLLTQARIRAKRNNLEFNLELSDIIIPNKCPILGIPLIRGEGIRAHGSPSVDKINNNKGYTKDNVRVISYLANHMKADASTEQLEAFAKNIVKYINKMI